MIGRRRPGLPPGLPRTPIVKAANSGWRGEDRKTVVTGFRIERIDARN